MRVGDARHPSGGYIARLANQGPPLILLTGFLGAGKTTILNRVLAREHHRKIGVVINELGRIDIDTRLIKSRSGDVMELAGGCVCHEVRVQSELWAAIAELNRRSHPELVLLETTGIAEPWSILDGLESLPPDTAPAVAAGVVCVVDAEVGRGAAAPARGGPRAGRSRRSNPPHQVGPGRPRGGGGAAPRARSAQPERRTRQLPRHRRGDRGARSLAARHPRRRSPLSASGGPSARPQPARRRRIHRSRSAAGRAAARARGSPRLRPGAGQGLRSPGRRTAPRLPGTRGCPDQPRPRRGMGTR